MISRLARAVLVALMVLLMAVAPLSAFLSGGVHETWLPGYGIGTRARVALLDHTGLVRAIAPRDGRTESSPTTLAVSWYGCGGSTLTFDRTREGFALEEQHVGSCGISFAVTYSLHIHLSYPIDPESVDFLDPGASVL
jgi:hypothetical protein